MSVRPGYLLMEFDLAGAEWVVVAYLANDKNMIGVVESGKSPHVVTGALISGASEEFVELENKVVGINTDPAKIYALRQTLDIPRGIFLPRSMSIRQAGKKSNHGLNYYMRYKRFALENEIAETEASMIVDLYSSTAYPGIQDYWSGIRDELRSNDRHLENCFGRKVRLLDEWGTDLWMAAYSFKPQSTVVDICLEAMCKVFEDESEEMLRFELGAQVHDSLMGMYPIPVTDQDCERIGRVVLRIIDHMSIEIDYGRKFTLGVDAKVGLSWSKMTGIKTKGKTPFEIGDQIRTLIVPSYVVLPPAAPESPLLAAQVESEVSQANGALDVQQEPAAALEVEGPVEGSSEPACQPQQTASQPQQTASQGHQMPILPRPGTFW